jgi:hypothetical protein
VFNNTRRLCVDKVIGSKCVLNSIYRRVIRIVIDGNCVLGIDTY